MTVSLNLNQEKNLATKMELADRVEIFNRGNSYITLKDTKEHFEENTKCRLINSNKPKTAKIASKILQEKCKIIRGKTNLIQ